MWAGAGPGCHHELDHQRPPLPSPAPGTQRCRCQQIQPNRGHPYRRAVKPATSTRMLWCGSLVAAAGAACASGDLPVPQASPAVVSPSAVCDVVALSEGAGGGPGSDGRYTTTVRFVAYGDVDSDDDVPCGMLSDVRTAVISEEGSNSVYRERDNMLNWWAVVGGNELGIERFIPPGVRVMSTAEGLSAAPAQFVTTGSDGTVEVPITYDRESDWDSVCAISPVGDLIAGCIHNLSLGYRSQRSNYHITVYTYFTHGHAIIEVGNSDRYQRFLNGATSPVTPATVMFKAESAPDVVEIPENILELSDYSDAIQPKAQPIDDVNVIVIDSSYVNSWWAAVSDSGVNGLDVSRLKVGSEVFAHDWVHVVTTGSDGLAETSLPPGDYLICTATLYGSLSCVYEDLASGHHTFYMTSWKGRDHLFIARQQ